VLAVPGGGQEVGTFLIDVNRVQQVMGGSAVYDEFGLDISATLDHHLVVVAPVSTGWDDVKAGDWSTPIGQSGLLFDLDDVDWMERIVGIVTRMIGARYQALMGRAPGIPVFKRKVIVGFSGGGCLVFRVISERPWLLDGAASAGSNCAGWENAFEAPAEIDRDPARPGWRFGPPLVGGYRLHLQIGLTDPLVWHLYQTAETGTPPDKTTLPENYVDGGAGTPPGFSHTDGVTL
jgi:hypothetical protein